MFYKIKGPVCVVLVFILLTFPFSVGAETDEEFLYEVVTNRDTGYSYIQINGYTGNTKDLTIPAEIDGLPVECIWSLMVGGGECPERLVIPEGVKVLRMLFGLENVALKEVILPDTLKIIGGSESDRYWDEEQETYVSTGAFANATALTTLTMPYSVAVICADAFPDTLTLSVEAGSYAARWAKANKQPYEIIQHAPTIGDYDADGLTTTTDARLLLQKAAGKVTFSEEQMAVADVDGDGEVTSTDARLTLQYAAGKEAVDTLVCPLTFDSPLIPLTAAETAVGSVMIEPDQYTREPGVLKSSQKMIGYLNAQIARSYHTISIQTIDKFVGGPSVKIYVDGVHLNVSYYLSYYRLNLGIALDDQFRELVME